MSRLKASTYYLSILSFRFFSDSNGVAQVSKTTFNSIV